MPTTFRLTRADFKLFSSQKMHHKGISILLKPSTAKQNWSRRVRSLFFTVVIVPLPAGSVPKIACVVSKKVSRKAVDRNRIKRRCRAAILPLMPQIKQSSAIAFYANSTSNKATFEQLSRDITSFLQANGFLK